LSASRAGGWRVLVDRGGTFTDVVALDPGGRLHVRKILSRDARGVDAITRAVRQVAGDGAILGLRGGTTLATNALLERRVERVALVVTRGFGDVLLIGSQERPELFALAIEKPAPLAEHVVEIDERVLADGSVRRAPDEARVREQLRAAREAGCRAVAVALVHAARFPAHERLVGGWARDEGFEVVLSHEAAPEPGHLARTETAVVDAALTPILARATSELRERLDHPAELRLLTSAGGLVPAHELRGSAAVLSGPAGGAVALAHIAREVGLDAAIGFDMGGTSTDVSRWSLHDGIARTRERRIGGVRIRGSMVDVVTVAAGGGSVLGRAGNRFTVGPESAGAAPGPACYGLGGPPTITDANLVLGRVRADLFPRCFGQRGDAPLDVEAARAALTPLAQSASLSIEEAAAGFVRIANERMAHAIRQVSVARGHDPREHVLVPFGGAGAQHACALADLLGMTRIVLHPLAGVLSALGAGLAPATRATRESVLAGLDDATLAPLERQARDAQATLERELRSEGDIGVMSAGWRLEMRHVGVEGSIDLPWSGDQSAAALRLAFETRHREQLGFERPEQRVEIASLSVEVSAQLEPIRLAELDVAREPLPAAPLHRRSDLRAGHVIEGPALIHEEIGTIVLDEGWSARVLSSGSLLASRATSAAASASLTTAPDAVRTAIHASRFMAIAEQMGEALRRTSLSVNIKERLDYSCALFTREGDLVANAPHVPVHLGAMGETVRALLRTRGAAGTRAGLVLASNDPYHGGSHLPDITVVSPVHDERGELAFFVANRGHHADVGGVVPGSMPPFSRDIAEEGVLIHDFAIVEDGRFRDEAVAALLGAGPHPVRGIAERLADLRAQAAANALGAKLLAEACAREGIDAVTRAMRDVLDDAAAATREALRALPQGAHRFEDRLDDGSPLVVTATIDGDRATFDFEGSAAQVAGNLNAPRAITTACVLYVLRCLVRRDVPLNAGCLEPVEIRVPPGSLLDPRAPAAVAGGNVETSMRIADVLLGALSAQAASQGTMNNLTFGDASFGYYETIAGGAGAGPTFDGAHAVHSHLTNTRITDVEVLESRHPIVLREFSIRRGSGGRGRHRGGDGIVRAIELRAPLQVAILSERRDLAPFGLEGGEAGSPGRNRLVRADGSVEDLGGKARRDAFPGDVLIVETPGGGGFGAA